jgi:hypothetical protein
MTFEEIVNDNRRQFGIRDTVQALVIVYGYTRKDARALVRRLRDEDLGPIARQAEVRREIRQPEAVPGVGGPADESPGSPEEQVKPQPARKQKPGLVARIRRALRAWRPGRQDPAVHS